MLDQAKARKTHVAKDFITMLAANRAISERYSRLVTCVGAGYELSAVSEYDFFDRATSCYANVI